MKKKVISAALAGTLAVSLLSACGASNEPQNISDVSSAASSEATSTTASSESTGDAAQELTFVLNNIPDGLDPSVTNNSFAQYVLINCFEGLVTYDSTGTLVPGNAESWDISDDGLTYTFHLRDGLKWSDGSDLTAEDYVYTIQRVLTPATAAQYVSMATDYIKNAQEYYDGTATADDLGVKALDDKTLEITLIQPTSYFIDILSMWTFSPVQKATVEANGDKWSTEADTYICNGPFKIASMSMNENVILEKNENYWDAENVTLEKATFVVMTDSTAQVNAFRTGDIDIAMSVPSEVATNAEYESNIVMPEKYVSNYFVLINSGPKAQVEALKDENVRKALALAIDKDTMLNILGGKANVRLDGYIPYGFEGVDGNDFRDEKSYGEFNLEEAKSLMEAAGYNENNHLKFEYLYSNSQFHADVAQILQQMWSQIYVDVELKSIEMGVFYDYVDNGDFTTCRYANNDSTDPLSYFQLFTTDSQIDGCQAITDPVLDQMVEEAYQITDHDEYIAKLHEIEDYFVEEKQYVIPLLTQNSVVLVQDGIEGLWLTVGGSPIVYNISVK